MKNLEDEIEDLEKLDTLRIRSAELREQGRKTLREVAEGWHPSQNSYEDAILVKALSNHVDDVLRNRVDQLDKLTATEIFNAEHLRAPKKIPIFRAARSMQALAAAPGSAFSEAILTHYYDIIREIYTADSPDWRSGGASAGIGGFASAYVTGECVRAILGFARTLENTSVLLEGISSTLKRKEHLNHHAIPESWRKAELIRVERDFYNGIIRVIDNVALKLDLPGDTHRLLPLTPDTESIACFLNEAPERISRAVNRSVETFGAVQKAIADHRKNEKDEAKEDERESSKRTEGPFCQSRLKKRFDRSESGHAVAFEAIRQGLDNARAAAALLSDANPHKRLDALAKMFRTVAKAVRGLIQPARAFLSTVLDRELTAACSEARPGWDPAELAFAATSYGFAAGSFDDDRLRQAGVCLSRELSARGRYPGGIPFYYETGGAHVEVTGAEVLRAFAQLLENVEDIPVGEPLVRRMLRFFEDTKRELQGTPQSLGWSLENDYELAPPTRWVTGLSVLALDKINRMLNARINRKVFRHFSVKKENDLKVPPLRDLFYPDYGLRVDGIGPAQGDIGNREETIALTLEKMRAHVLGIDSSKYASEKPLYSLILHGPAGTGKTTLVEALARSAGVPLIEVTPSDIVAAGADVVERRARAVFRALSLLTRVVILFDEFDPVLKRREPDDSGPSTVFTFVTPGMLPKLKRLHETAKDRNVAYTLITNLIGTLDRAAIRSGRFDCKVGIYPPDPLSRAGRLLDLALARRSYTDDEKQELEARLLKILKRTRGASVEALTQKGWLGVWPKESPKASPQSYLLNEGGTLPRELEREAFRDPSGKEKIAQHEWCQWKWVDDWEDLVKTETTLVAALSPKRESPPLEDSGTRPEMVWLIVCEPFPGRPTSIPLHVVPEREIGPAPEVSAVFTPLP